MALILKKISRVRVFRGAFIPKNGSVTWTLLTRNLRVTSLASIFHAVDNLEVKVDKENVSIIATRFSDNQRQEDVKQLDLKKTDLENFCADLSTLINGDPKVTKINFYKSDTTTDYIELKSMKEGFVLKQCDFSDSDTDSQIIKIKKSQLIALTEELKHVGRSGR